MTKRGLVAPRWMAAAAFVSAGLHSAVSDADAIDGYVERIRRIYRAPAIVLGVIKNGVLTETRAWGQVNVELGVKAGANHVFEIGSISKQFTAYGILILKEEGKLELDSPVGRYVDGLPEDWAGVTLHRLLTHTSGLPDFEEALGYGIYRETPTDDEFLARITKLTIEFRPGERWSYSNTNYWLLARVIERCSGLPYADFMQRRIFVPLGMTATRSALPREVLPGRASGYERRNNRLENHEAIQPSTGRGLGDIATTVADMARWEREQLSPRLVSAATAELARVPVKLNSGEESPYGYGWFTGKILRFSTLHHDGQTAGFVASYLRVPERGLAVIVLCNEYGGPATPIAEYVAGQVDSALRKPRPQPIPDHDPALTRRIVAILVTAHRAPTAWQSDWFGFEEWARVSPGLSSIAEFYGALGRVRRVTLVGREDGHGQITARYRGSNLPKSREF